MPEVSIGNVQSDEAKTGVTVLLFDKKGAVVGVDISGGGPASRETPLTSPVTADNPINAIVLSGGSAYGLAAADGVMRCLEDHRWCASPVSMTWVTEVPLSGRTVQWDMRPARKRWQAAILPAAVWVPEPVLQ